MRGLALMDCPSLHRYLTALLLAPLGLAANPCQSCHPKEVAGYSRSAMSRSLRRPGKEPEGSFTTAGGTKFTIYADRDGTWQRMERGGETSEFRISYVIGSGNHASGYLIQIGDHLFQSPVCYYPARKAYDLAPGYEKVSDPDFTRPVTEACLLCHSGAPLHVAESMNRYEPPVFKEETISCERCHGATQEHLKRPLPGTIVNPAKLTTAARDSVCEQCHLAGIVRVLNPGKDFGDFHPGQRLEEVLTIFTKDAAVDSPGDFKVISHSEQLALSACARNSKGKLWCGTCHNPHSQAVQSAQYYQARCSSCHSKLGNSHPGGNRDCVSCHMPRRQARDGGHSVFTDHRIARRPQRETESGADGELVPWRHPEPALEQRNLALAIVNAGIEQRSPSRIVKGYRMLTEVQKSFPDDVDVLDGLGMALLLAKQPAESLRAFERVLQLTPNRPVSEQNVAMAWIESGRPDQAAVHLERCLTLDPLLLPAAVTLTELYRQSGDTAKESALVERMGTTLGRGVPAHPDGKRH